MRILRTEGDPVDRDGHQHRDHNVGPDDGDFGSRRDRSNRHDGDNGIGASWRDVGHRRGSFTMPNLVGEVPQTAQNEMQRIRQPRVLHVVVGCDG